jgi:hypothetical protein
MAAKNRTPIRFSLLTVVVWLAVAGGIIFLLWQVITRISGNNLPVSTPTPNLTQVYQTIAAMLATQQTSPTTAPAQTVTPSPAVKLTQTPSTPLPSPVKTNTPAGITQTIPPQAHCDQAAAGNPIDITIPDDSLIAPGQSFIKTWKLVNSGTCNWTTSYSARFFYGDRMGAPETVPLQETVLPSQSVEISIEMVAPLVAGTYQGNWKLSNPNGVLFGIGPNGDSPFWVRIIVSQNPSNSTTPGVTATLSTTASPSPTTTTTPPIQASGELSPIPGDSIDLDSLTLNSGDADLIYQVDANNYHWLSPNAGAMIGVFGSSQPNLSDCRSASMSPAPIAVESLSIGTYLCYTTNEDRFGRALLEAVDPSDFTLTLDLLTWALP